MTSNIYTSVVLGPVVKDTMIHKILQGEKICPHTSKPWDNFLNMLKDPLVVQTLLSVSRKTPWFPTAELSELLSSRL